MKKRILSAMLALCLFLGAAAIPAYAAGKTLKFDGNGEFKILHMCDFQDGYPAKEEMMKYINRMLEVYEPDLVVLGGDNCVASKETKEDAIKEIITPFVEHEVYFTLVFGNHDDEQGVDKDTLLKMYQKYGGKYCLAYDVDPDLSGTANHNLPIYSSDGKSIKFNVWMLDTGTYVYDENGNRLGYDSVRPDQIEWYKSESKKLEEQAGAKVPSLAFQHMVVQEVYEVMFPKAFFEVPLFVETYSGVKYSVFNPKTDSFAGHLFEPPSPGYYNHGEVDAMVERGDVLAILAGHDHYNTYEIDVGGIDVINTPGTSFNAYGIEFVRGSRLITIKEDNPWEFDSKVITVTDLIMSDDKFAEDFGMSRFEAFAWISFADFLLLLKMLSAPISWLIYW